MIRFKMNFLIKNFLLNLLFIIYVFSDSKIQYNKNDIFCESKKQNSKEAKPHCIIHLHRKDIEESTGLEGCDKISTTDTDTDTLVVRINRFIQNLTFVCKSNSPLETKISFEYETPIVHYTNVRRKRICTDYYGKTKQYEYKLTLDIPTTPRIFGPSKKTTLIKYGFYNFDSVTNTSTYTNVLFYILKYNYNMLHNREVHWMQENQIIEANDDMILIPCLSVAGNVSVFHFKRDDLIELTRVRNEYLRYDPVAGIWMNIKNMYNPIGAYICTVDNRLQNSSENPIIIEENDWNQYKSKTVNFVIQYPPLDFQVEPNEQHIVADDEYTADKLYNLQMKREPFLFECSSTHRSVNITIGDFKRWSGNLAINITTYEKQTPQKRFYAKAELTHVGQEACIKNEFGEDCLHDIFGLTCHYNINKSFTWTIRTKRFYSEEDYKEYSFENLFYDSDKKAFVCDTEKDNSIKHSACHSVLQCQMLTKCFQEDENGVKSAKRICINSLTHIAKSACQNNIIDSPNMEEDLASGKVSERTCQTADTALSSKGIIQCSTEDTPIAKYKYYRIKYFIGFDGQAYAETRLVPQNSTLKLIKFSPDKLYYTNGTFTFYCQAQSFFYEDGIIWLQEHTNGSILQVPEHNIRHISSTDKMSLDSTEDDAKSLVEILFVETSITKIICAAPKIYSSQAWGQVSVNVEVHESSHPVITSDEIVKYFRVGDSDQSITCKTEGFPIPEIKWSYNGKEIEDSDRIIDKVISKGLIFPKYTDSLAGDYKCRVSNIAGENSKLFQVRTFVNTEKSSDILAYTLPSVGFAILLLFMLSVGFVIRRRMQKEKYREIQEVINLLRGSLDKEKPDQDGEVQNENPLNQQYDEITYELVKGTFYVYEELLIGKGEFGEVFKGRIDGVDGQVAFKKPAKNAPILHMRMLVSELKIMMYIGHHENIVELLGAYTQEIKHGNFLVATEYCGLGSLETYLRSYKHLFRFISNLDFESNNNLHLRSFHTFEGLLIWCGQIANAMEYLNSKKVIHSDLATRNILLTADAVAKVTDFGLSRRTYNNTEYVKKGEEPLPWQWLALETLKTNTFSMETDIWAYGITLWEIFSFGDIPYAGYNLTMDFVQQLENGFRNSKPKHATREIFEVMLSCWQTDPTGRPNFHDLKSEFEQMLKTRHYISLEEIAEVQQQELVQQLGTSYVGIVFSSDS